MTGHCDFKGTVMKVVPSKDLKIMLNNLKIKKTAKKNCLESDPPNNDKPDEQPLLVQGI